VAQSWNGWRTPRGEPQSRHHITTIGRLQGDISGIVLRRRRGVQNDWPLPLLMRWATLESSQPWRSTAMNSNNLTKEQAKKMHAALLPTLRYLNPAALRRPAPDALEHPLVA
jgi:hypothetical protein